MLIRAKYYGAGLGAYLQRVEEVLNAFDISSTDRTINDILEYYNIILIFDDKLNHQSWDMETIEKYTGIVKQLRAVVGRFLNTVQGDNLCDLFDQTDFQFQKDFIAALVKYRVIERITDEQFVHFIDNAPSAMRFIIAEKKLVAQFGEIIAERLSDKVGYAELVINHYFVKHDSPAANTFMPDELSRERQEKLVRNYINWDNANINYLNLISGLKKAGDFPISDRIRLLARRKARSFWKNRFINGTGGMRIGVEIRFLDQSEPVVEDYNQIQNTEILSYSKQWVSDHLDNPTLLNNFIFLFKYVDWHYRCLFLSNPNYLGTLERLIGIHGNSEYSTGLGYVGVRMQSCLQMCAYQTELRNHSIEVEDLFKWFFEEYLKLEYSVQGYTYCAPSKNSSTLERILLLASQLDAILKQFRLFIADGEIDRELFEISSLPYKIVDTPSMIEQKYLYPESAEIKRDLNCLFSDQCLLCYPEKTGDKYHSFAELIISEDISLDDYPEYCHAELSRLLDRGTITTDATGRFRIKKTMFSILYDLHRNGNIAFSYCDSDEKQVADELLRNKDLTVESSLFTRQEKDYLDYMLNVQQFINGPELRNKYVHGTFSLDPKVHNDDYLELLKIMTLIVLKINEEFSLKYPSETGSGVEIT